jgi:hypothetical protein
MGISRRTPMSALSSEAPKLFPMTVTSVALAVLVSQGAAAPMPHADDDQGTHRVATRSDEHNRRLAEEYGEEALRRLLTASAWETSLDSLLRLSRLTQAGELAAEPQPDRVAHLAKRMLLIPSADLETILAVAERTTQAAGQWQMGDEASHDVGVPRTPDQVRQRVERYSAIVCSGRDELKARLRPSSYKALRRWIASRMAPDEWLDLDR